MTTEPYPTPDRLRELMLAKAEAFSAATKISLSALGRRINNDSDFFKALADDRRSPTLKTYERVMSYLDANWPPEAA